LLPEDDPTIRVERQVIAELLEHLPQSPVAYQNPLIAESLDRAEKLHADGDGTAAREIWPGLVALYRDDPTAAESVQRAQQRLYDTTPAPVEP
jgi:hypothetical protein